MFWIIKNLSEYKLNFKTCVSASRTHTHTSTNFAIRIDFLRLYEMDAIYTSTMPIYAININKMVCLNSKMSTGSGYWVSADWNIAISTPFPQKSIGCISNNIFLQLTLVTFFETSIKNKLPKVIISPLTFWRVWLLS